MNYFSDPIKTLFFIIKKTNVFSISTKNMRHNYKLYIIDLEDLQGLNLHTCTDNQGKTCYKIPLEYYNKLKDYPPILDALADYPTPLRKDLINNNI